LRPKQTGFSIIFDTTCDAPVVEDVIGRADQCGTSHGGIFLPFEHAYADYDVGIIGDFFRDFEKITFRDAEESDSEYPVLFAAWAGGIARTLTGVWMAHMMKSLEIARGLCVPVFFIIRDDGQYQGSVLKGSKINIRSASNTRWEYGVEQAVLDRELEACGGHHAAVKKILDLSGLPCDDLSRQQYTTLRKLANAVNVLGRPSGLTENMVKKLLPDLSFIERPDAVNVDTIESTLDLCTNPDAPIPDTLYMDKGYFFSEDRFEQVLCRFGDRAPTLNWGGRDDQRIRCCSVRGRGIPDDLQYDRAVMPTHLSMKKIAVTEVARQWHDMLYHGHLKGIFDHTFKGGRELLGNEKKGIWDMLDLMSQRVIKEKGQGVTANTATGGAKRAREMEKEDSERLKKKSRLFSGVE
jgi:hypothetical protein